MMISKEKDMNKEGGWEESSGPADWTHEWDREMHWLRELGFKKLGFENRDFDKTCDSTGLERFRIPLVNES
jgi:hypothetical protein